MKGNDSGTKYAYYKGKNTSNDLLVVINSFDAMWDLQIILVKYKFVISWLWNSVPATIRGCLLGYIGLEFHSI